MASLTKKLKSSRVVRKSTSVLVIAISSILLFEFTYRVIVRVAPNLVKAEQPRGLDYGDTWRSRSLGFGPGGYLKENFDEMVLGAYGNTVRWKNNVQGFRNDYDVTPEPGPGVVRVISIGDSFTTGYRLAQNETFSFRLEQYLNSRSDGRNYEVLISAVDDPTSALDYLSSVGLSFKPKLVLLGLTLGNDISQAYVGLSAGGSHTLDDETGQIKANVSQTLGFSRGIEKMLIPTVCIDPTKSSFLDRRSITYHIIEQFRRTIQGGEAIISWYDIENPRLFDPANGLGIYLKQQPDEVQESYEQLFRSLRSLKKVLASRNIDFLVAVFPQRFQVQPRDWTCTVKDYRLHKGCFDLNLPNKLIANFCAQNEIACIDTTGALAEVHRANRKSLYFPQGDMHLNTEGNRVVFEAIKDEVYRRLRPAED